MNETLTAIKTALSIHLNVGQNITINSTAIFASLQTKIASSLSNTTIIPFDNTQIHFPSSHILNLNNNDLVSIHVSYIHSLIPSNYQKTI